MPTELTASGEDLSTAPLRGWGLSLPLPAVALPYRPAAPAPFRDLLPAQQIKVGENQGSWDPGDDLWANYGGRLMVTCLHTLMLETYYRYAPLTADD